LAVLSRVTPMGAEIKLVPALSLVTHPLMPMRNDHTFFCKTGVGSSFGTIV
jgi:hypothetical protein